MTEIVKGFIALIRQVNNIMFTNCIIHREALSSKELSAERLVVMNPVVRSIRSIKLHTEILKGKCFE